MNERVKHIHEWERKGAHSFEGEDRGSRNFEFEEDETFECEYCNKSCKSKGGLIVHIKKMHEKSLSKKSFTCDGCKSVFEAYGNLVNHKRNCSGIAASNPDMRRCTCGKEVSAANFRRHQRSCGAAAPPAENVQVNRIDRTVCNMCGAHISKANLARHQENHCPGRTVVL